MWLWICLVTSSQPNSRCGALQICREVYLVSISLAPLSFFSSNPNCTSVFLAGLSHQPPDFPRVQSIPALHGQLPVELQDDVSARRRCAAEWGAAPQEQRPTVLDPLQPHPPPRLHELRCWLPPEGGCRSFKTFSLDIWVVSLLLLISQSKKPKMDWCAASLYSLV